MSDRSFSEDEEALGLVEAIREEPTPCPTCGHDVKNHGAGLHPYRDHAIYCGESVCKCVNWNLEGPES